MDAYWVYILASRPRGTLYVGVTNGLIRRVEEHANGLVPGFTLRYRVHTLVWFQEFASVNEAIQRERTMKEWPRAWKVNLIEQTNPHWEDLYPSLPGVPLLTIGSSAHWIPATSAGMTIRTLKQEHRW